MAKWMRIVLFATAVLNMVGAALFVPFFQAFRISNGFPAESHPLYLWIIASWIFMFGLCYFWLAVTGGRERLFLVIGAGGKFTFVLITFIYWQLGQLPANTFLASLTDLFFAITFAFWLFQTRGRSMSFETE